MPSLAKQPESSRWLARVMQSSYWSTQPIQVRWSVQDEVAVAIDVLDLTDETWRHIREAEKLIES